MRNTTLDDVDDMLAIGRIQETAYWAGMEPWKNRSDADYCIFAATAFDDFSELGIIEKETGRFVGIIDVTTDSDANGLTATLGYFLAPDVARRGYMSEAVSAVCKCLFETFEVDRVMCKIRPDNIPSRGVAIKCGFVQNPCQTHWELNHYGKPLDEFILTKPQS